MSVGQATEDAPGGPAVTKAPKPGSPVCPDCKKIYESMKKG